MYSLDYYHTYSDTVSKSVPSSSSKTYAVIHMGPHKTGTTTVKFLTDQFMQELNEDGYRIPFELEKNGVQFASCFIRPCNNFENRAFTRSPCAVELLLGGLKIGKQMKNLLVSAEPFDNCIYVNI